MTMRKIYRKWKTLKDFNIQDLATEHGGSLYIEYICLCNFASDKDFYFYLHPQEATEAQFLSVLDFLYSQDCYVLLGRFLRGNQDRLVYADFDIIEGIIPRPDLNKICRNF